MTHFVVHPWRDRLRTAALVVAIAVPVGVVIGGGLDLGGSDDEVLRADDPDAAGAETTTSTTATSTPSTPSPTSTTPTSTTPITSTTTTPPPPPAAGPGRPAGEVRVRFYNGSRTAGAAVIVGRRLEDLGYRLLRPGPSPADPVASTTILHRPEDAAEAADVARALGVDPSAVAPLPRVPPVAQIGNAQVVVIVGDELVAAA